MINGGMPLIKEKTMIKERYGYSNNWYLLEQLEEAHAKIEELEKKIRELEAKDE
jgi:hypothetical protein